MATPSYQRRLSMVCATCLSVGLLVAAGPGNPGPPTRAVEVVNDRCAVEYRVAGPSETAAPPNVGINQMHLVCQRSFGEEARMCSSVEALRSPELFSISLDGDFDAFLSPVIVSETIVQGTDGDLVDVLREASGLVRKSPAQIPGARPLGTLNCNQWTSTDPEALGLVLSCQDRTCSTRTVPCIGDFPVLCCAPRPPGG